MAISKTTDIASLIPKIYETARLTAMESPVIRQLAEKYDIKNKPGNEIIIPRYGTVTAATLTEGVDLASPQTIATTPTTLYVFESGAQTQLTDNSTEDANDDVLRKHGMILGDAMAEKDDKDGIAVLQTLTAGVGAAATDITVSGFTVPMTMLRVAKAKGDVFAVMHSYVYHKFAKEVLLNATYGTLLPAGSEIGKKFRASEFLGVQIFEDNNIPITTDSSIGAMFTRGCLGRAEKRALRIEKQRDASARAWELNATTRYGYGLVEPTWGVKMTYKTVAPTA